MTTPEATAEDGVRTFAAERRLRSARVAFMVAWLAFGLEMMAAFAAAASLFGAAAFFLPGTAAVLARDVLGFTGEFAGVRFDLERVLRVRFVLILDGDMTGNVWNLPNNPILSKWRLR